MNYLKISMVLWSGLLMLPHAGAQNTDRQVKNASAASSQASRKNNPALYKKSLNPNPAFKDVANRAWWKEDIVIEKINNYPIARLNGRTITLMPWQAVIYRMTCPAQEIPVLSFK